MTKYQNPIEGVIFQHQNYAEIPVKPESPEITLPAIHGQDWVSLVTLLSIGFLIRELRLLILAIK